ncbi:MAG TPA: hypothetical protein VD996_02590 [Chitinophagaceae bacterium]|nr:hypothetical protein [Chitinophagaceae bacterium]
MVTAILDGRKTQTRRIVKNLPNNFQKAVETFCKFGPGSVDASELTSDDMSMDELMDKCPYGNAGDILYVRETFWQVGEHVQSHPEDDEWRVWQGRDIYHWQTDGLPVVKEKNGWGVEPGTSGNGSWIPYAGNYYWRKFPSIHLPKKKARIWLKATDVRVERLQDISEADAIAEGVLGLSHNWVYSNFPLYKMDYTDWQLKREMPGQYALKPPVGPSPKARYSKLIELMYGLGSWNANPWVWVIYFDVLSTTGRPKL